MTAKVAFALGEVERLLIPQSALIRRSEVVAVYVVAANRLQLRQVRLGHRFAEQVEVLSGLAPGEQIALDPLAAGKYLQQVRLKEPAHD